VIGAATAAGAGCGAGLGVGAVGVGVGVGVGAGLGVGVGVGVATGGVATGGVATGGVAAGGCGACPTFVGVCGDAAGAGLGVVILTGARATGMAFTGFRTRRGNSRGSAGATTTTAGPTSLRALPEASGSTNGTGAGVSASDHSRADPTTHAAATSTAPSRRVTTPE
jgi:hypothetical protein